MSLASFLTQLGDILTAIGTWVGIVVGIIMDNPIILVPIGASIVLVAIGVVRRLLGL